MACHTKFIEIGPYQFKMTGNHPHGIVTSWSVIGIDQIEINRQPWHVPHKEINGGSPFEGKRGFPENDWSHGKQQSDCIKIGSVYDGLRMRVLPFLSWPIQRPVPILPAAASRACSAHGRSSSVAQLTQRRTAFTMRQWANSTWR